MFAKFKTVILGSVLLLMTPFSGWAEEDDMLFDAVDQPLGAKEILEKIQEAGANRQLDVPTTNENERRVDAAFNALNAKLKAKPGGRELEADEAFDKELNAKQKGGLKLLKDNFSKRVAGGDIKIVRGVAGRDAIEPGSGPKEGRGQGRPDTDNPTDESVNDYSPYHAVGDGWWRWSTSYSWWGVKVSVNHNFLYYLCRYTSWMLNVSGLPGWIKTVLGIIACGPHNLDSGFNGATIYITWAGVFWYSP
jgi:hypothetical protein